MSKKILSVSLPDEERHELQTYVNTGIHAARSIKRARILLLADRGMSDPSIATHVGVCKATVFNTRRRYCTDGLKTALDEKKRPGAPRRFTGRDEANLTVLACSSPPTGAQRWTMRLLADKLIKLGIVETISPMTVQRWLKKMN
jgi:transposase